MARVSIGMYRLRGHILLWLVAPFWLTDWRLAFDLDTRWRRGVFRIRHDCRELGVGRLGQRRLAMVRKSGDQPRSTIYFLN